MCSSVASSVVHKMSADTVYGMIVKVMVPHYRPGQAFGLKEVDAPRIPRQLARESHKTQPYAPATSTLQETSLVLSSVRG
jgi:hypothetical protein